MTPAQFDQAVKDYFHSLTPLFVALDASRQPGSLPNPPQVYQFPEIVAPDLNVITAKPIPEADGRAIVAEVKSRIPDRRDTGLQELQALAAAPNVTPGKAVSQPYKEREKDDKNKDYKEIAPSTPGNEIAHRALAWDYIERGEFDSAAEALGDAAALNQRDMWIRYYLSVLKYRMALAKNTELQGLSNMMQDLRAVIEWYPEFADAYDLLAIARTQGGGPVAALQAERAAMQLSPRNQQYLYHLALIYVSDKKWEAARSLLERLKASPNSQVAAAARERLSQLGNEQKYGISTPTTASGKPIAKPSSPFDVLEEDAAKRAAAAQTQSASTADKRPSRFFQGRLVGVDCSQSPAAVLTVTANGVVLKLRTADYKSLLLIGADTFSCSWNDRSVSVNYKPGGLSDGDLVSVEVR
jgi:tetratricopeptide (TPR) repeat protein